MGDDLAVHGHVLTHEVPDGYPSLVTLLSMPVTMMAWDMIEMMNVLTEENGQLIAIDQFEHSLSFFTE